MSNFDKLVEIIGPDKAAVVSACLAGKVIFVKKKPCLAYLEYCKKKPWYDAMRPRMAAHLLGCTVRYFKKLRSTTNRLLAESAPPNG